MERQSGCIPLSRLGECNEMIRPLIYCGRSYSIPGMQLPCAECRVTGGSGEAVDTPCAHCGGSLVCPWPNSCVECIDDFGDDDSPYLLSRGSF